MFLAGALTGRLDAQAPLTNVIFTVGTSARAAAVDWSYLMLNVPAGSSLVERSWEVFGKEGRPGEPGSFTRRGVIQVQTTLAGVSARLQVSPALGQDITSLSNTLNVVLRGVPGVSNQPTAQKILTAFQAVATNQHIADRVQLLTRGHPALALCAGRAFSEAIAGVTTYEIREVEQGAPGTVVGRVIIDPANVTVLPAPGRPVQVITNDPSDHLVVRLRWGTPLELRQLSPLGYCYNVWRAPKAVAEQANWHTVPPTRAQLLSNPSVLRVNDAPAMANKFLQVGSGPGAAEDSSDRITAFFADRNGVAGHPFADGEEFYYFVTARDLLGRDGQASPGGLGRACRRVAPEPPRDLQVANAVIPGSTNVRRLQVDWEQNTDAADRVTEYWIYRWPDPAMVHANEREPLSHRIQIVPARIGTNRQDFLDVTPGAFTVPSSSNVWYTVRAVSQAACGPLLSAHSAPASGVLRDWTAPEAPSGTLVGSCGAPTVIVDKIRTNVVASPAAEERRYRFTCVRRDRGVAWVEFFVPETRDGVVTSAVPRLYFPPEGDRVTIDYTRLDASGTAFVLTCTVGNAFGRTSGAAAAVYRLNDPLQIDRQLEVEFLAGQVLGTALTADDRLLAATLGFATNCFPAVTATPDPNGMVALSFGFSLPDPVLVQARLQGNWVPVSPARLDASGHCWVRYPDCLKGPLPPFRACVFPAGLLDAGDCAGHVAGAGDGTVAPIVSHVPLTPGTEEYRLYRQTDGGPLTLIAQGAAKYAPAKVIEVPDSLMPVSPARLCYFVQLLDEHGNGSPMASLGCRDVLPEKLPRPVLSEPVLAGDSAQPKVTLYWSCPPAGVERFKITLKKVSGTAPRGNGSSIGASGLIRDTAFYYSAVFTGVAGLRTTALTAEGGASFDEAYFTPPLGPDFGVGPEFSFTLNVPANVTYAVSVAPVFPGAEATMFSDAWEFTWKSPTVAPPPQDVPWPARPLPPVGTFHPGIGVARIFTQPSGTTDGGPGIPRVDFPVGVRIGAVRNFPRPEVSTVAWPQAGKFTLQTRSDAGDDRADPIRHVFSRRVGPGDGDAGSLLPVALYRQQLTNDAFPNVSGDVSQVSPLIEQIAVKKERFKDGNTVFEVLDPLITGSLETGPVPGLPQPVDPVLGASDCGIYLLDSQPMLANARYRYLLVRFKPNREIDQIIAAGEITTPDN